MPKMTTADKSGRMYALRKQQLSKKKLELLPAKKRAERERYANDMTEALERAEQILDPAGFVARKEKERLHGERKAEALRLEQA